MRASDEERVPWPELTIRQLSDDDSIEKLTDLLHRAYHGLAERGFQFSASSQSPEETLRRVRRGECFVATRGCLTVGTVMLWPPTQGNRCEYYRRDEVAHFGQFAVEPALCGKGIGIALLRHVEDTARERGFRELALDTAADAEHLVAFYGKRGYRPVNRVRWRGKRGENVVMSKCLVPRGGP